MKTEKEKYEELLLFQTLIVFVVPILLFGFAAGVITVLFFKS